MGCLRVDIQQKKGNICACVNRTGSLSADIVVIVDERRPLSVVVTRKDNLDADVNVFDSGFNASVNRVESGLSASVFLVCYPNVFDTDSEYLAVLDGFVITIEGQYMKVLKV